MVFWVWILIHVDITKYTNIWPCRIWNIIRVKRLDDRLARVLCFGRIFPAQKDEARLGRFSVECVSFSGLGKCPN
jgi:hypothetical protein